ncbi:2-succinyl-5-enolpyruvyl-6-hydroxy-3-cyclohexene-1-carboxylate synthase [Dyadobacter sp. BE34]|uniref:2-succinyl-5-enolpyruvyl-6-hydroxy-3-cyclohexene-1-carboxylate synthase n=1 Tax=Dyadobacter fermentans TaxID=94254 RepID=A0ABU1QXT0_9BACT|nr:MULTISPECIES: 2-succinyl-5-enolpyruvyl-6-hydroxy-3-cyclohexene-1-carboxylic-acid synthase [Dyadobacter]MDR6805817.1 2-succinyl-5-enolpyruvyl-6-hydroxy-3-cyclohexene-1-carboxylate synthase [Dyadobacter fermentans]MDR7042422.1 2-succinyl-5-enolpyruvyl-6-hydroxy-3-cyclohexene-1-carboxylate synthase [Dyadobacter sp. BE242]MDR7196735.1 2-succinyl-5-enolpyruvyl-6-hydroxy-3-cyclohexene-1-carboxylate synthase [Dyadobacter sp. BE34]MDR7215831.1 2-succinyl-5-enolpyruvyl-6-hydroxy-3-cyclohexene-1-carbo
MAILQPLIDMAEICYRQGIRHVVISPGSRSAALTLAFARHGGFRAHVCMDERSAGFIALGMAQQIDSPVVLICTSGSAAYNFAPAVSEAFFQQIPLLILTADRPKEWQHQYDGQTIYQTGIFGQHVKRSFEVSPDYQHSDVKWAINRVTNEAINLASMAPNGPVHINVPIREPFYPAADEVFNASGEVRVIQRQENEVVWPQAVWEELLDEWESAPKILIAGGQGKPDAALNAVLDRITEEWQIPVLGDCIANLSGKEIIRHHDLFLGADGAENLRPDLLITFGMSFLSKEFKQFIRKNPPRYHWNISEDAFLADPFQSVTRDIPGKATAFFENLFEKLDYQSFVENTDLGHDTSYYSFWVQNERKARQKKHETLENLSMFNDLTLLDTMFKYIRIEYQIHIANSMSVRYANVLATENEWSGVFANRGTSGIDGCVSTAIGAARLNGQPTLLIVGDVAFLYDRNGLLIDNLPQNLKIVVLNNAGGNIFRMIDGPGSLPELETFFETRHAFSARRTCEDSGIAYFRVSDLAGTEAIVKEFLDFGGIALLEGFTDPVENTKAWKVLKRAAH